MRVVTIFTLSCWLLLAATVSAKDKFPYEARISLDEVEVRCGPGWEYYTTGVLKRGQKVQVYRHEPGGWLAIRPTADSFSLIVARQVQLTRESGVGRVTTDGAVAWVGSSVTAVRQHKWQIRLEKGELLAVSGNQAVSIGPGFAIETYYKIAPPSGEFRWIHAEHARVPKSGDHRVTSSTIQLAATKTPLTPKAQPSRGRSWLAKTTPIGSQVAQDNEATGDIADRVQQLNADLGLLVSKQIDQWQLDSLRDRARQLNRAADGTQWADQVEAMSRRITEFESLKQRYLKMLNQDFDNARDRFDGVSAVPRPFTEDANQISLIPIGTGVSSTSAIDDNQIGRFDAEGWLVPVHSTKRIAPPYALLDDDGRVRSYVSPVPGLNLRRYERKYVGLYGQQRYARSLRAPHITVKRVVKQKRHRALER